MKKLTFVFLAFLLFAFAGSPIFAQANVNAMDNAAVLELQSLGLGDEVIVEKIKASKCTFDVSIEALKALKAAKVSNAVIAAMVAAGQKKVVSNDPNDPAAPHDAGIYLYEEVNGKPKMTMLKYVLLVTKTTGFFEQYLDVIISEPASKIVVKTKKPVFYFYFGAASETQREVSGMFTSAIPESFAVIPVEKKDRKRFYQLNLFTNSHVKNFVGFDVEKIGPATFKAVPKAELPNGEFCVINFVKNDHGTALLKNGSFIYDFAVDAQ